MGFLKAFFPLAFGARESKDLITLIVTVIIGVVICGVVGWVAGLIPLIGWIIKLALGIVSLYLIVTLALGILVFLKVIDN